MLFSFCFIFLCFCCCIVNFCSSIVKFLSLFLLFVCFLFVCFYVVSQAKRKQKKNRETKTFVIFLLLTRNWVPLCTPRLLHPKGSPFRLPGSGSRPWVPVPGSASRLGLRQQNLGMCFHFSVFFGFSSLFFLCVLFSCFLYIFVLLLFLLNSGCSFLVASFLTLLDPVEACLYTDVVLLEVD